MERKGERTQRECLRVACDGGWAIYGTGCGGWFKGFQIREGRFQIILYSFFPQHVSQYRRGLEYFGLLGPLLHRRLLYFRGPQGVVSCKARSYASTDFILQAWIRGESIGEHTYHSLVEHTRSRNRSDIGNIRFISNFSSITSNKVL